MWMDPGGPCERSNEEKTGFSNTCNFLIYSPPPSLSFTFKKWFSPFAISRKLPLFHATN